VRILHPNTNQLLREHLRQKRGGYRIEEEDHPKKIAELPHGYAAWALTTLFLRSSGQFNTDPACRTGVLVRRSHKFVKKVAGEAQGLKHTTLSCYSCAPLGDISHTA
jgi:hypothetical protein